ncbi:unnamed protein product [Nyctereutes procyonoides]|uniref:(raccoon dog) hypothetical protein n=1 Tax=Nyctereutes procyonoides TaxID=34880 RepID=A0A811ZVV0_NYCPR|nr:unnamed protein product [Nyctereutes procyonoides]
MSLHCWNSHDEFLDMMERNRDLCVGGAVHSFDGTKEAGAFLIDLDLYIEFFFFNLFTHEKHTERGRDTGRGRSRLHAGSKYIKTSFSTKKKWENGHDTMSTVRKQNPLKLANILYNIINFFPDTLFFRLVKHKH